MTTSVCCTSMRWELDDSAHCIVGWCNGVLVLIFSVTSERLGHPRRVRPGLDIRLTPGRTRAKPDACWQPANSFGDLHPCTMARLFWPMGWISKLLLVEANFLVAARPLSWHYQKVCRMVKGRARAPRSDQEIAYKFVGGDWLLQSRNIFWVFFWKDWKFTSAEAIPWAPAQINKSLASACACKNYWRFGWGSLFF